MLQAASLSGNSEALQMLIKKGADFNATGGCFGNALQAASSQGHEEIVQMLLDKGADVKASGSQWVSALQAALASGQYCPRPNVLEEPRKIIQLRVCIWNLE